MASWLITSDGLGLATSATQEKTMHALGAAVVCTVGLLFGSSALAEDASTAPPKQQEQNVEQQHPEWFTEHYQYRPCPSNVEFANGREACLGLPTPSFSGEARLPHRVVHRKFHAYYGYYGYYGPGNRPWPCYPRTWIY
jgi:hypothetical protein